MQKIIVIGCPGSGKSHFSKELHKVTHLPLHHLDMMFWNSDKTTVTKEIFRSRLDEVLLQEQWIIDGNYASTMDLRMEKCDTVFFLDYPTDLCLKGIEERMNRPRSDIPWVETEHDEEFLKFIENFQTESRPKIIDLLKKHSNKQIFVFKSRAEAEEYIKRALQL